jgi:hypothetical protein
MSIYEDIYKYDILKNMITYHRLKSLFVYPKFQAAIALGITEGQLVKECRRLGINKWPYYRYKANKRKNLDSFRILHIEDSISNSKYRVISFPEGGITTTVSNIGYTLDSINMNTVSIIMSKENVISVQLAVDPDTKEYQIVTTYKG